MAPLRENFQALGLHPGFHAENAASPPSYVAMAFRQPGPRSFQEASLRLASPDFETDSHTWFTLPVAPTAGRVYIVDTDHGHGEQEDRHASGPLLLGTSTLDGGTWPTIDRLAPLVDLDLIAAQAPDLFGPRPDHAWFWYMHDETAGRAHAFFFATACPDERSGDDGHSSWIDMVGGRVFMAVDRSPWADDPAADCRDAVGHRDEIRDRQLPRPFLDGLDGLDARMEMVLPRRNGPAIGP